MNDSKMTLRVLVTGGNGFVGSFIVDALLEKHPEWEVTIFDLVSPELPKESVKYEKGSVTDIAVLDSVFERSKPNVVVHTAGIVPELAKRYSREVESQVYHVNVTGTENMLRVAKKYGTEAFVWTGSCTAVIDDMRREYRNIDETVPTSTNSLVYGETKAIGEAMVLAANDEKFSTCALRPSVLFGEGDHQLVPSVHACIAKWETPFVIGDGLNLWDATYAGNIADAHVLAVENLLSSRTAAGEAIFISNEEPITFRDFSLAVWRNFGHYPPFTIHIPKGIATVVAGITELVTWVTGSATTICRGSIGDATATRYCNGAKARRLLGYQPQVGLEEGLRRSCLEYAARLELQAKVHKEKKPSLNKPL